MDAHKAVFLFPVTKSLRYQKERLEKEGGENYVVTDVDDPLEAGQLLSMAPSGILFCSDTKKLLKCLEKYEKLFNDSKFKIILVLPKRIMGKEVADLNNRGVQDILVEPVTEKALTTKVEFNFKMITKLIEAALKKAKRAEEAEKAKLEAMQLKKEQDLKRKQKEEERKSKKSIDSFWSDQEKAAQDLMFKPVEGKQNGTDSILKVEDSVMSLNSVNLFHSELEGLNKTITDGNKKEADTKDPKHKKNKFDFPDDTSDDINAYESGDKTSNATDTLDGNLKNSNGLTMSADEIKMSESGTSAEKNEQVDKFQKNKTSSLFDEGNSLNSNLTGTSSNDESTDVSKKSKALNFQEAAMEKKMSGEMKEGESIDMKEGSSSLLNTNADIQKNNKGLLSGSEGSDPTTNNKGRGLGLLGNNDPNLKSSSSGKTEDELNKEKNSSNFNEADENNGIKGKNAKDHEENNQLGKNKTPDHEENNQLGKSLGLAEDQNQQTKGKGALADGVDNLNKGKSDGVIDSQVTNTKSDVDAKAETIDPLSVGKGVAGLAVKDLEMNKSQAIAAAQDPQGNKAKDVAANVELTKTGDSAGTDAVDSFEKSAIKLQENPTDDKLKQGTGIELKEVNIKKEMESNFVDEFTKAKTLETQSVGAAVVKLEDQVSPQDLEDLNSVIFNEPPSAIVLGNLHAIDTGILLLQKLSSTEQKVEEQVFIFPTVAKKIYEDLQGLVTFYVIDPKAGPTLLYSSHKEKNDFYASLGLPPVEEYVTKNIATWQTYRYTTINDESLQKSLIEIVYPFREGARTLGVAVIHCYKTIKDTKDINRLEMLLEFTRGYFMRFHNIGGQGGGSSKSKGEEVVAAELPWYQKYINKFNDWLNKQKKPEEKKEVKKPNMQPIKKPFERGMA